MTLRVIIADDHKIMREGLRALLQKEPGIELIGEAAGGRDAVRLAQELKPDVMVMDVAMPDLSGIEATRLIHAALPGVKVIALSMHSDRRFVREMLAAGASGYLLKDAAYEELSKALQAVCSNHDYLSPDLLAPAREGYSRGGIGGAAIKHAEALSMREREILQLIAEGKSTHAIASALCLSEKTVAAHRSNIMHKIGVKTVAELTKYAIREGLTSLGL